MTKAYILQEIRRTAEVNSGKPLGEHRFKSETGIKKTDWYGIHWACWGDALQEAGYMPNQLQAAYDKGQLLESYAAFAMELGELPAEGNLRLKARHDKTFPSSRTFHDRLGPKRELVRKLAEYCRNVTKYEKVFRLCEQYAEQYALQNTEGADESRSRNEEIGFVYLLKSGKYYTIGRTNAVGRREYEHGRKMPEKIKPIHSIKTDDPVGIEAYWQKRFEGKKTETNGSWYDLGAADVTAFKRRKFM